MKSAKLLFIFVFCVSAVYGMQQSFVNSGIIVLTEQVETKQTYKKSFFLNDRVASLICTITSKNNIPFSGKITDLREASQYKECDFQYSIVTKILLVKTIGEINKTDNFKIEIFSPSKYDGGLKIILDELGCENYAHKNKGGFVHWGGYLTCTPNIMQKLEKLQNDIHIPR